MFQSSAGREAGCDHAAKTTIGSCAGFNPQPAGKPAATPHLAAVVSPDLCFNPQPAGKPAATALARARCPEFRVSILSRPGSRLRPDRAQQDGTGGQFQSSAGREAGCDVTCACQRLCAASFQSSAGREAGCDAPDRATAAARHRVSILSRPGSRLRRDAPICEEGHERFQSSAGREAGCDVAAMVGASNGTRFNPQPAGKPAATMNLRRRARWTLVSILSRPGSRLRRMRGPG